MPRALSHVTLITAWISGCVCRIGDWAEHSCSETGYIFLPAVDFSSLTWRWAVFVVCCGSHHLCLPQPPMSLAEGCWVAALVSALPESTSLQSCYDIPSLKGSSVICITKMSFLLVPIIPIGQWELLVAMHNPSLRNSAILCLLFSGLIAGRPNMALLNASALASLLAELSFVSRERVRFGVGTSCSPPW